MKTICVTIAIFALTATSATAEWYKLTYPQFACTSAANYDIAATLSQQDGTSLAQIEEASGCKLLPIGTEVLSVRPVGVALALTLVKVGDKTVQVITNDVNKF